MGMAIAQLALSLVGTPWVHQGRTVLGLDCVGFIIWVLRYLGWEPKDPRVLEWTDYTHRASDEHVLKWARAEADRELSSLEECQTGDILVVRFEGDEFAQHVGILIRKREDGVIWWVHASNDKGVIYHRLSPEWKARFVAGFRFMEGVHNG